jgi:hypothetical protein
VLNEAAQTFTFDGFAQAPVLSLNRGFSAPVAINAPQTWTTWCSWPRTTTMPLPAMKRCSNWWCSIWWRRWKTGSTMPRARRAGRDPARWARSWPIRRWTT